MDFSRFYSRVAVAGLVLPQLADHGPCVSYTSRLALQSAQMASPASGAGTGAGTGANVGADAVSLHVQCDADLSSFRAAVAPTLDALGNLAPQPATLVYATPPVLTEESFMVGPRTCSRVYRAHSDHRCHVLLCRCPYTQPMRLAQKPSSLSAAATSPINWCRSSVRPLLPVRCWGPMSARWACSRC